VVDDSPPGDQTSDDTDMALPLTNEAGPDLAQRDLDQELFEALSAGDEQSLAEFVHRNEAWVRGVVFSALGDTDALDDVMQKVWLAVWQRCGQLEDTRRWRYWLYRMARNAAIDFGRKKQRRRKLWQRLTHEMLGRGGEPVEADATHAVSIREQHQGVLDAIQGLPEIYREPFVLRHVESWTYKQIAETLDLPVDTVGTRLVRARRMLQEALGASDES